MDTKNTKILALQKKKVPPQVVDLEEAVLGALMIDKNAISEIVDILHTDCFYKESHQEIYDSLIELFVFIFTL